MGCSASVASGSGADNAPAPEEKSKGDASPRSPISVDSAQKGSATGKKTAVAPLPVHKKHSAVTEVEDFVRKDSSDDGTARASGQPPRARTKTAFGPDTLLTGPEASAKSRRNSLQMLVHPALPATGRNTVGSAPETPQRLKFLQAGDPNGSPPARHSSSGAAKASILKTGDAVGGKAPRQSGSRSIAFKNGAAPTDAFLYQPDLDSDDERLTDEDGPSRAESELAAVAHLRMESVTDHDHGGGPVSSAPSILSLAGGLGPTKSTLLGRKGLQPSEKFSRPDSGVSMVDLPPVKSTGGHRSVGHRSIGGTRSIMPDLSFMASKALRDIQTPNLKGGEQQGGLSDGSASEAEGPGSPGGSAHSGKRPTGMRKAVSRLGVLSAGAKSTDGSDSDVATPGSTGRLNKFRRASAFLSTAYCAISIRYLRRLLIEYVVPLAQKLDMPLSEITTSMVNELIVKRLTREEQCRLVDMPGVVPKEDVGPPDYFVSHAWSNPFSYMVQCVCDYLSGALDTTKVWIDILAVNQHPNEQQQDDLANLRTAIHLAKGTLVCCDVGGAPLKRVWCLYECDNTITLHGPDRLMLITPNFSVKDIASVFKSISVENAGVFKETDKQKIIEDIVNHHGSTTAFDNKLKLLFLLEPLDQHADLAALLEGTGGPQEYDFSPLQEWLSSSRGPQVCVISGPQGSGKSTVSAALCWDENEERRKDAMAKGKSALAAAAEVRAAQERREAGDSSGGAAAGAGVGPASPAAAGRRQVTVTGKEGREILKPLVHAYHFCRYSDVRRQSPIRIVKTLAYQLSQKLPLLRSYYAGLDLAQVSQLHQASAAFRLLLLKPLTTLLPRDEQVVILIDAMDEADAPGHLPLDNPVLQLMLHQLCSLPRNVRIITSTRSAPHLMGPLRRKFNGALELTPNMVRRRETTMTQLERRLTSRFGGVAAAAVMGCGGGEKNLVFYSVVMLLEAPLDDVPQTLFTCYKAVFALHWPKLSPAQRREGTRVLQVLMAAREPLYLSLLAGLGLEHALKTLPGWGILFFEREYKVYTLHKSLHDWLQDTEASAEFYADPKVGHATLGRFLYSAARPLPAYGTKYLVAHLIEGGKHLQELLDQSVTDLDHLEAVARAGYIFKLQAELAAYEPKSKAVADVTRWLGLNSHVLWAHPSAVLQLAHEAPPNSAIAIALKRPRRASTINTELLAAAAGAITGAALLAPNASPPVQLLNKATAWPAQLSILAQHHKAVNSVAFSPSGTLLASGSEDRSVRLWDVQTGEQKAVLFGHSSQVLGVSFSPDGQLLASTSCDSTVRLWDAATGEEKGELLGHVDWVRDVSFAPAGAGRLLASCGDDKTVKLWDISGQMPSLRFTLLGHTDTVHSVSFCPDGALLVSASADRSIRLWDASTGRQAGQALVAHKFAVTSVAFSPDGAYLASGSDDKMVFLWDLSQARINGEPTAELAGHMDKVLSVCWSVDGLTLASASADGSVRLWDTSTRKAKGLLLGHASIVVAVAFSPTKNVLASAASDNTVRLWDPVTGSQFSLEKAAVSHMDSVTALAFSPSGHTVASAGQDWTVRLWDPSDGNHRMLLQGHTDIVRSVAFSPTGNLLASASSDWTVRLWDPVSGLQRALLQGHQSRVLSVAFSPNGRLLASSCHDGTAIIWDSQSFENRLTLKGHAGPINAVTFSPTSKQLATASADRTLRLWQTQIGEQQMLFKGHKGSVTGVSFNALGNLLASASTEERMVRVWDPASGNLLCCINSAALCAGGQFSMYSLSRHAPCVRAIALQPRASAGSGSNSTNVSGSGVLPHANTQPPPKEYQHGNGGGGGPPAFQPMASFGRKTSMMNYSGQMLQPSMTMRAERRSSTGGGPPPPEFSFTTGPPPVLSTMMSMRSSATSKEEIPKLMELVAEENNPILSVFTPFVTPRCVVTFKEKIVMSDGPHIYFYEALDAKAAASWRANRRYSAAC